VFSEPSVLRITAALAAATAAVGAAVMRRWDVEAGKRVADLTRARASDEWRHEERIAELETDLDESRELRTKLEHKLRAKRTELAGLRNEHAALLRRYATAETERASALEGRRLLEIEATVPEEERESPAAGADADTDTGAGAGDEVSAVAQASPVPPQGVPAAGAPWASWETASKAAAKAAEATQGAGAPEGGAVAAPADAGAGVGAADVDEEDSGEERTSADVFSPAGSALFLRANSALDRIITQRGSVQGSGGAGADTETEVGAEAEIEAGTGAAANEGAVGAGVAAVVETAGEDRAVAEDRAVTENGTVAGAESETASVSAPAPGFVSEPGAESGAGSDVDAVLDADVEPEGADVEGEDVPRAEGGSDADAETDTGADAGTASVADSVDVQADESVDVPADRSAPSGSADATDEGPAQRKDFPHGPPPKGDPDGPTDGGTRQGRSAEPTEEPVPVLTAEEDDAAGKSVAVRGHERAAADPVPAVSAPAWSAGAGELTRVEPSGRAGHVRQAEQAAPPALPALPPAGHFTVPTAVAVMPASPQRRAAVEGGFDFFGTQKGADALEAVQNEDLADVVGQEALALHKAESEARFKQPDEASRGVGQVIDLTAHDETEQIDLQGLRTAAS
jgi:hypothetical protein